MFTAHSLFACVSAPVHHKYTSPKVKIIVVKKSNSYKHPSSGAAEIVEGQPPHPFLAEGHVEHQAATLCADNN